MKCYIIATLLILPMCLMVNAKLLADTQVIEQSIMKWLDNRPPGDSSAHPICDLTRIRKFQMCGDALGELIGVSQGSIKNANLVRSSVDCEERFLYFRHYPDHWLHRERMFKCPIEELQFEHGTFEQLGYNVYIGSYLGTPKSLIMSNVEPNQPEELSASSGNGKDQDKDADALYLYDLDEGLEYPEGGYDYGSQGGYDQGSQGGYDQGSMVGYDQGSIVGCDQGSMVGSDLGPEAGYDQSSSEASYDQDLRIVRVNAVWW